MVHIYEIFPGEEAGEKQDAHPEARFGATTGDFHLPPDWINRTRVGLKIPPTHESEILFTAWARTEGGNAKWNPINSTLWVQNYTLLPNYNDIPVRNYAYETAGVSATVLTLIARSAGVMLYGGIVGDLQAGVKSADQIVKDRIEQFHKWGTDTDLLLQVIADVRAGR